MLAKLYRLPLNISSVLTIASEESRGRSGGSANAGSKQDSGRAYCKHFYGSKHRNSIGPPDTEQAEHIDGQMIKFAFKLPWSDACKSSNFGSSVIASISFSGICGGIEDGQVHCIGHVTGDGINGSAL